MTNVNIVDAAMLIALDAHAGDRNKHDGEIYSLHLARVWINVREAGGGQIEQAVAWLHDSIEDTPMDINSLHAALASTIMYGHAGNAELVDAVNTITTAVDVLTKKKGESNEDYYSRVKLNEVARFVKLHGDIKDNFRRNYKIKDPDTAARMSKKYSMGLDMLG